ncbi:MAG: DUF2797 domain-containing protein [Robiginitalea sp.]|uniref:DUF2797 domain-containing protein n=1 Tax=Robiginitalea sp. TaxID=1902411 RepID=UPI003C7705C8
MQYEGVLRKMQTEFENPIAYYLVFPDDFIHMNLLLDRSLSIRFLKYECLGCGEDLPIFRQGYCKNCFFEQPQAGEWIVHPERSKAHLGEEDRDLAYEQKVQLQPHIVYLANSSSVKVGVTRKSQVPTRWIDQGAHEAIEIVETPNRYLAGITEVALKEHVGDKTHWRNMLTNQLKDEDLFAWREKLRPFIPEEAADYFIADTQETEIHFPVLSYPTKVKSLNLNKTPEYNGILKGIKGQYLIFADDTVFNIRGNEGYYVALELG